MGDLAGFRRRPLRIPKLLQAARGRSCSKCSVNDGTVVRAHYSGYRSSDLGKGGAQKADDHCGADLCLDCHTAMDAYAAGNDAERAVEFLILILKTQRRDWDAGVLKIAGGKH